MFKCFQKKAPKALPAFDTYRAAGCCFVEGNLVLAGLQPRKGRPVVSGLGGHKEAADTHYLDTAVRETLEELLGSAVIPKKAIEKIQRLVQPSHVVNHGDYVVCYYSFDDLKVFLRVAKQYGVRTYIYDKFPASVQDLVFKRKKSQTTEVETLGLLPLAMCVYSTIDGRFLEDLSEWLVFKTNIFERV